MAYVLIATDNGVNKYKGNSIDTKPSDVPNGSRCFETDTRRVWVYDSSHKNPGTNTNWWPDYVDQEDFLDLLNDSVNDAQLGEKATKGEIVQEDLSDTLKLQIAGTASLNSIPENGSVTLEKLNVETTDFITELKYNIKSASISGSTIEVTDAMEGELTSFTSSSYLTIRNKNLHYPSNIESGSINSSGQPVADGSRCRTKDYIRVTTSQITLYGVRFEVMYCYDINKNYLGQSTAYTTLTGGGIYTLQANTAFVKYRMLIDTNNTFNYWQNGEIMLVQGATMDTNFIIGQIQTNLTVYQMYEGYNFIYNEDSTNFSIIYKTGRTYVALDENLLISSGLLPIIPETKLPDIIPNVNLFDEYILTAGREFNFYNTAVVCDDGNTKYIINWSYTGTGGRVMNKCFRINENTAGTYTLTIKLQKVSGYNLIDVYTKSTNIIVTDNVVTTSLVGMYIGDSYTNIGYIPKGAKDYFSSNLTLLGTKITTIDTTEYNHEGRGGWSSYDYMQPSREGVTNPFYNPSTLTFDFSYYMSNNYPAQHVDFVSILLGQNDAYVQANLQYFENMITSIKSYDSNIKVMIMTPTILPTDRYYFSGIDVLRYREMNWMKWEYDQFSGREANGVYWVQSYPNLNINEDWGHTNVAESYRNPTLVDVISDSIHPNNYGMLKISDASINMINYVFGS